MQTLGLSPKLVRSVITAVVAWVVTRYGLDLDPEACASVAIALLTAVGYLAPPGDVVQVSDPATIPADEGDAGPKGGV